MNYDEISLFVIFKNLLSCSFQTALGYICLDIVLAISLHFVSQELGSASSAGVGLAYTLCSIIVLSVGAGFNQSLNVHVSQALGATQYKLSKTYLPINLFVNFMIFFPLCVVIYSLKIPFSYTIPEIPRSEIINLAWEYLPWLMVSTIFAIQFECFKSYLIAHEIFTLFIYIHLSTTGLHYLWCWLLIQYYQLGIRGAGMAIVLTEILNIIILTFIISFCKQYRTPFNEVPIKFSVCGKWKLIKSYLLSSYSIVLHVYVDYLAFFVLTIIGMQLGTELFNSQMAFANTNTFYFRLPISLSIGLMAYVGAEMGRKRYKVAQKYVLMGCLISLVSVSIFIGLLYIFRQSWVDFYSNDPVTQKSMLETLPTFLLGCLFFDSLQGSISGGLKGIDKSSLVSNTTILIYYFFCIPVVLSLTFSWGLDLGVSGIWIGFGIANAILFVIYATALMKANWRLQEDIIASRIQLQELLQRQNQSAVYSDII